MFESLSRSRYNCESDSVADRQCNVASTRCNMSKPSDFRRALFNFAETSKFGTVFSSCLLAVGSSEEVGRRSAHLDRAEVSFNACSIPGMLPAGNPAPSEPPNVEPCCCSSGGCPWPGDMPNSKAISRHILSFSTNLLHVVCLGEGGVVRQLLQA